MSIIKDLRIKTGNSTGNILWPAFTELKDTEKILQFFEEYIKEGKYPIVKEDVLNGTIPKRFFALNYLSQILHEYYDGGTPYFPEEVRDRWDEALIYPTWEKLGRHDIIRDTKKARAKEREFSRYFTAWEKFTSLTPDSSKDGVAFYSKKELGDLVTAQFPMKLSSGRWKICIKEPTHILYFSQFNDRTYVLNSKLPSVNPK